MKAKLVRRIHEIRDRAKAIKDRVLSVLDTIRETQDAHHKQITNLVDKRLDESCTQVAGLSQSLEGVSASQNAASERMDQRFNLLNQLIVDHHVSLMYKLGATNDNEKYKIASNTDFDFDILPMLPHQPTINVLDIGAMQLVLQSDCYGPLQKAGICRVVGIEPNEEACARLREMYPGDTFIQQCVGRGDQRNFYVLNDPMCSSLYKPDLQVLQCFENLAELFDIEHVDDVHTIRLDDVKEVGDIDFIKNDTQGAELEIFEGALKCVSSAVVIECEVEFVRMYKDQPLFCDIDVFLRNSGFEFHRFTNISGRLRKEFPAELIHQTLPSQTMWANAVYVRSMFDLNSLPPKKLLKLAIIMHMVYKSYDLTAAALSAYDRQFNTRLTATYRNALLDRAANSSGAF